MLSMDKIRSPAQAATYFEVDDYYTKGGGNPESRGTWYGRGAAALDFEGDVDPHHFKLMLQGQLPNGQSLGSESGEENEEELNHTPGWDLTFSAPKGVSIVAEVGRDKRVFEAHGLAVREALRWVEDHSLGTRVRSPLGRLFLRTQSLVAALFTHHTSRNQDPDLHTHSVVMNAVEREEGRWASVHSHVMFKHKMAVGTIYRAALARELQKLGYEIDITHRDGRFEIVGIPEEVLQGFSTRREEIKKTLDKWGVYDAESAAKATKITRTRKKHVERAELLERWQAFAEKHGFDVHALVAAAEANGPRTPEDGLAFEVALKDAIDLLSERKAVFDHADVVRYTQALLMGRADVATVEELVKAAERDGRLRRMDFGGLELWTTPRAIEQERRILDMVNKGKDQFDPIANTGDVEKAFERTGILNPKQRVAGTKILTTRDQFTMIVGLPGVGKTTMLKYANEIAAAKGKRFIGMSQNSNVAQELHDSAGMESSTIDKHLTKLGKDLAAFRKGGLTRRSILEKYQDQVWIVDEGSQLPNDLKRRLMTAATRLKVPMAIVGDHRQIGAINAGDPFNLMRTRGAEVTELDKIVRTENTTFKEAIVAVRNGLISKGLKLLAPFTEEVKESEDRIEKMLDVYRDLGDQRKNALFVTARNDEKTRLNDGARKILLSEGKLTNDTPRKRLVGAPSLGRAELRDARFYEPGFIVRFRRSLEIGIKKGEYWKVKAVDKKTNTVTLERPDLSSGEEIPWNPREIGTSGREGAEVYKLTSSALAHGDLVRWAKNIKIGEEELFNGQMLTVARIEGDRTTFIAHGGRELTIDQKELEGAHWGHAYASTVYSSQGRSVEVVIVNAESNRRELLSQKAFLVAISRQKIRLHVFTDDKAKLERALLNHPGDKSTATEAAERAKALEIRGMVEKVFDYWDEFVHPPTPESPTRSIGA